MTPFPVIAFINEETKSFINEETIDPINEAVIGGIITPKILLSCFFIISCLTVSVAPTINRSDFSSNSNILTISPRSSFEINKVNPFSSPTAPLPVIFLSNLFITFKTASEAY